MPEDIIILCKCTKNHNHICYNVPKTWCMTDVIVIFILGYFLPFDPKTPKINILKKWKKTPGDIIILHKCTKKFDEVMYIS